MWYIVFIVFLICCSGVVDTGFSLSLGAQPIENGTWYVGGSGPGNYSTIQGAISNSSSGDTIFVYSGIYNETFQPNNYCCVKIPRSLNLIGENKTTTIINGYGRYDTISVTASNVNISGFTIQRGGTPGTGAYGRGLSIQQVSNVKVMDVILTNNYLGIILYWNTNILIDHLISKNKGGGISFWDGRNCTIAHCIFDHAGISVQGYSPSRHGSLSIRNNLFTNNSGISLGDLCIDTHGNTTIESNQFENNSCSISIYLSKGINIFKNNFINNDCDVSLSKECFFRQISIYKNYKQNWMNNYWDDWNHNGEFPISGIWTLDLGIPFIFHFMPVFISIPILKIPYKEYDLNPAQEPFDIGG